MSPEISGGAKFSDNHEMNDIIFHDSIMRIVSQCSS